MATGQTDAGKTLSREVSRQEFVQAFGALRVDSPLRSRHDRPDTIWQSHLKPRSVVAKRVESIPLLTNQSAFCHRR